MEFITGLKTRLVGTTNHDRLIDHIQSELEDLAQEVLTQSTSGTSLSTMAP